MLNQLIGCIHKVFRFAEKPQTYGSALETYIVSKNPQNTSDVEYWTRRFDERMSNRTTQEWPL